MIRFDREPSAFKWIKPSITRVDLISAVITQHRSNHVFRPTDRRSVSRVSPQNSETKSTSAEKDARRALCHGCVARGAGPGGEIRTLATLTNLSEGEDPDDPEGGGPRGRDGH